MPNEKRKKLHDYLSSNGMTDLSYDDFSSEYASNKDKQAKLYSYISENKMTDLGIDDFANEYFLDVKKKDTASDSSTPVEQPTPQQSEPSEKSVEVSPKYIVNEQEVDKVSLKDNLFNSDFIEKAQSGEININISNDPELEALAARQLSSGTQMGDKWDMLESGLYTVASGVTGAKNYLANVMEEVTGIPFSQQPESLVSKKVSEDFAEKAEEKVNETRQYKEGFVNSISEGNYLDATNIGFNALFQSAPISAVAAASGGVAPAAVTLATLLTPAEYSKTNISKDESEKKLSNVEKLTRSALYAGAEGVGEAVTGGIIGRNFSIVKDGMRGLVRTALNEGGEQAAKEVAEGLGKKTATEIVKAMGVDVAKEGGSEIFTQVAQDATDDVMGVRDLTLSDYVENAKEAGALGVFMGGVISSPARGVEITKSTIDAFRSGSPTEKAVEMTDKKVEDGEITEEQQQEIIAETQSTKDAIDRVDPEMTEEQQVEAIGLIKERDALVAETEGLEVISPQKKQRIQELDEQIKTFGEPKQQTEDVSSKEVDSKSVQEPQQGDATVQEEGEPVSDTATEPVKESTDVEVAEGGGIKIGDTVKATVDTYKKGKRVQTTQQAEITSVNEDGTFDLKKGKLIYKNINPVKIKKFTPPQTVESETKGLTDKEVAKQGLVEITDSYKSKIKDIKEQMSNAIKEAKGAARSKAKAVSDARNRLDDFIKETVPKGAKVSRGLLRKVSNAKTDKAIDSAMDYIENYLTKASVSELKNNIKLDVKKVAKKLRATSEYTNKERVVAEFLAGLDLNEVTDINNLDKIASAVRDLANKPIANVREGEIKELTLEPKEAVIKPIKEGDTDRLISKSKDKDRSIKQRAYDINRLIKESDRLNDKGEDTSSLDKEIEESVNELNKDTKDEVMELNKDSDELISKADLSDLSTPQRKVVNELKEIGRRSDYRSAKMLNDIAIELSFGYAPLKNIQEYINSEYSRRVADTISNEIDSKANKRKTKAQETLTSGFLNNVVPNIFKRLGVNKRELSDVITDLRLSDWHRWDEYFGIGIKKPIAKYITSPLERAITAYSEEFRKTMKSLRGLGLPITEEKQTKMVMAMTQGYWSNYRGNEDYWGELINNKEFKENNPKRHKEIEDYYNSMPKNKNGIDYDKYLSELSSDEKKVYDWIVKNNNKMKELQRTANERRGEKFEEIDSRYYIPMIRNKDFSNFIDNDGYVDNLFKMFDSGGTKLKSDTGISRTDKSIDDLNTDLYRLIQNQVVQTTRDYYVTETVRKVSQALGKTRTSTKDLNSKKYLTAMNKALKSRLAEQFGASKGSGMGVFNIALRAVYQYVLSGTRIFIETGAETIRGAGATNSKYWADAAKIRAASVRNDSLRELLEFTDSPFLSSMYFEMIEGGNETDFSRSRVKNALKKIGSFNEKLIASSDAMTFGITWLPTFLKAYNENNADKFNVKEFIKNPEKYLNENKNSVNEAASVADSHTQTVKGSKTRMGKREAVKVLPFKWKTKSGARMDVVSSSTAIGRLVTTLQNFANLEAFNIVRNINSAIYQENKTRGEAIAEIGSSLLSGTFYGLAAAMAYTLRSMMFGDDEEKKAAEEEYKRLTSFEGLADSALSNLLFLAGGAYGNISKTGVLITLGLYDLHLKKTLSKSDYKKQSKELREITRNRYFADPIKFDGYKTENDVINSLAPFLTRSISLITNNISKSTDSIYDLMEGNADEKKLLSAINAILVLSMMPLGMAHPFAKEFEYVLRERDKKKK